MTRLLIAAAAAAVVAAGGLALGTARSSTSPGAPPPELTAFANQWPGHNLNLDNTRATAASQIDSTNAATLKPKWTFRLKGHGRSGSSPATRSCSETPSTCRT